MSKISCTVSFNLKDKTAQKHSLIYAVVYFSGNRLKISTGKSINPKQWSSVKGGALSSYDGDAMVFNKTLKDLRESIINQFDNFILKEKREPSVNELKQLIDSKVFNRGGGESKKIPYGFFEYFRYYIDNQKKAINTKTNKPISYPTIRLYENVLIKLKEYNSLITFDAIDMDFYYSYIEYLRNKHNLRDNSIGGHIKVIKALFNDAFSNGITTNLIFKSKKFSKPSEETDEIYLTIEELKEIENLDLSNNDKLRNARDLLILLCNTGQRFQSLPDIINPNNREGEFINIIQPKGNKKIQIPILPATAKILDKGEVKPISNVNLNKYIKQVCKLIPRLNQYVDTTVKSAGMKVQKKIEKYKLVRTHTGRRSFCTNFYKLGYPVDLIMGISGHESEKVFYTYIREMPKEKAQRFLSVFNEKNKSLMHKVV